MEHNVVRRVHMTEALIDSFNSALTVLLVVVSPILLIGLAVSLVTSLMQAMTQVQEQTLNLVPRLLAMLLSLLVLFGWMLSRIMEFAVEMFSYPS